VDLERHIDYIHYNPVKHGFTTDPGEWRESSFLEWVRRGYYAQNWGTQEEPEIISEMNVE
jgi:putative transposase